MEKALEDAYLGKPPQTFRELPNYVTPAFTLDVMARVYQGMKEVAVAKLTALRAAGVKPSPYDARFMRATKEIEAEFETTKLAVYRDVGLTGCEDTATVTLHNAITKFSHEDPSFSGRLQAIECEYREHITNLMQDRRRH
jgi:hypothetical protein